ncbi:hypothetical protein [Streptomyces sp. NPDC101776]|uniref:AfsR/SARP family transcriptional regulator n=1 Tax=Streptomyces sp. NPDC101776 TaxID=3366146 RepID=UPI0037F8A9EB
MVKLLVLGALGVELADGDVVHVRGLQATLITELPAAESVVVSTDRLADALYGDDIPRQPLRAVHAHMTRLRRALRQWEPEVPGAEGLLAKATGYLLKVSPLESDAGQFLAELTWVRALEPTDAGAALEILEPAPHAVFASGRPLPGPVDAVMESVGRATWSHSLRSARPGGTIVVTGAISGADPIAHLNRIFWNEALSGSSAPPPAPSTNSAASWPS